MYPCLCLCHRLCLLVGHAVSPRPSDQLSERTHVSSTPLQCSEDAEIRSHTLTHPLFVIVVMSENVRSFVRALCIFSPFHTFVYVTATAMEI